MIKPTVICVVPVKNESWILKDFIEAAQGWADQIIIADHNSTDDSVNIAQRFEKVKIISCQDEALDRGIRRKLLIEEARKVPGRRLIFTLDADEMISANWVSSPEWELMLNAQNGTRFDFDWIELFPGLEECDCFLQSAAFMDDDSEYTNRGTEIHESRIPETSGKTIKLNDIKLLHYIFIDLERMFSKHRWYKCIEYIERGQRPWSLCIMYQDTKIKSYDAPVFPVNGDWLEGFDWLEKYKANSEASEKVYWHDEEVLNYFDKYGTKRFSKLNIWDIDWNKKAQLLGRKGNYSDPRSKYELFIHTFIEKYREQLKIKRTVPVRLVRLFGRTVLQVLGW